MTAIDLTGLVKEFGSTTAVAGVDLRIPDGSLFFLLGPSGCGKTTLLRMIAGFIEPTQGKIAFDAKDVTPLPPNRRHTGMVFQSYALWPHMTVAENVAYGLRVRRVDAGERQDRVMKALEAVQMGDYAKRKPNQLSGGQQQRVALARALVIEPAVLLLDEPLSNLDAKLRLEMRSEIRRICTETKITTVYVTHDQKEALSMADHVAVLNAGKVVQVGPPRELYERPASRFVAEFLGETNFLAATVEGKPEPTEIRLRTSAGTLTSRAVPADLGARLSPGQAVTCSLRPEVLDLRPDDGRSGAATNHLSGIREETVYLGEVAQHIVRLDGGDRVRILELNPSLAPARVDERIQLAVSASDVIVLLDA